MTMVLGPTLSVEQKASVFGLAACCKDLEFHPLGADFTARNELATCLVPRLKHITKQLARAVSHWR